MLPVPPVKVEFSVVPIPTVAIAFCGANAEMLGASTTVTVTLLETVFPVELVTDRMKVVVAVRLPVEIATPLATAPTPFPTIPVPFEKTPVSVVLVPAVMEGLAAAKLEMLGTTGVGCSFLCPPPPHA